MLSKFPWVSPRKPEDRSHYNRPSRNVLRKEFAASVTIFDVDYFVCGNGSNILVGEYFIAPGRTLFSRLISEIAVFPQLQVTVRGIIAMCPESYILAFGANYLAMIGGEQVKEGGHLCQSSIVSTSGVIVAGRRIGENKVQVFYESGCFETFEVVKTREGFRIVQKDAKKLILQEAKVTSMVVSGPNVLLGTSSGQVLSNLGKIYFKGDERRGAVRQMTVINDHIVLLLFQNKAVALLDLRYHALRSVIEGRFTAIESVFFKELIMAGDLDGTLHCLSISPKGTQMTQRNSYKCIDRDAIYCMFPIYSGILFCATAMGAQFVVNRQGLVDSPDVFFRQLDFGSRLTRTSKDKCYFLNERRLYRVEGQFSSSCLDVRPEYPDVEFSQLKHYRVDDFEAVYAFGGGHFFCDVTHKKKQRREHLTFGKRITTAVVTEGYFLIQQKEVIMIYSMKESGWKANIWAHLENDIKVSTFTQIKITPNCTIFLIATQNMKNGRARMEYGGRVLTGYVDPSITSLQEMTLHLTSTFRRDFVVSMQTLGERIYVLTANAKLHIYVLYPGSKERNFAKNFSNYKEVLYKESTTSYKISIGRGYGILSSGKAIYLVGFKQNMLNVYKIGDQQILSMPTRGPRSSYAIHEDSDSSMSAICDMGAGVTCRSFPKVARMQPMDVKNAGNITHIVSMLEYRINSQMGVLADFVTGDCNGLVALMRCPTTPSGPQVFTSSTHQMKGAITAMGRDANYLFVGTSTGALAVFEYKDTALFPCLNLEYSSAVTSIQCIAAGSPRGALVRVANGHVEFIKYTKEGQMKANNYWKTHEPLDDIKWSWTDSSACGRLYYLSKDGILYMSVAWPSTLSAPRRFMRSIDRPEAQRYSHFRNVTIREGDMTGLAAGYFDGMVLFAVYGKERRGWRYFAADCIHRHEIIDSIFYKIPSNSGSTIWTLATLDKAGLYVQRTFVCDSRGIRLHGLPMKWYCPVRNPKAMALLEKKREVIVVGNGLATLVLSSLAPPPPIPTTDSPVD